MENQKKSNKKLLLGMVALVAAIAVLLGIYFATRKPTVSGDKTIGVQVILADGTTEKETSITTSEEYLRGALEQEGLIEGSESEYGLYVTSVDGIAADDSKNEWWCFTRDGEMLDTGVDSTPIADGEHYEITLSTY